MKRLMVLMGLMLFLGTAQAQNAFNDVRETHINQNAIQYLRDQSIVEGYEKNQFKPENRINRAEFIKMIVASQVKKPTGKNCFSDVREEWFARYICTGKKLGWIDGYPDGTFKPGDYINFAEASKIVTKALGVKEEKEAKETWFAPYVKGLESKKAIPSTLQSFDKDLSRGEMAETLWRLKTNRTDKVSLTYEEITEPLPAIRSCEALKEKFDEYQSYNFFRGDFLVEDFVLAEPRMDVDAELAPMSGVGEGESAKIEAGPDFSTTNVQVAGVDEADLIKNDGEFIYLIRESSVRIVKAYPPTELKEVGQVWFESGDFDPRDMYVNKDQLIIIGTTWGRYESQSPIAMVIPPLPYLGDKTRVVVVDITDRKSPQINRDVIFDGYYHSSRRIDDRLILVLNQGVNNWDFGDVRSGEDLLPRFKDTGKPDEEMVGCSDIRYFPGHAQPSYLIAASIPLDDPDQEIDREVILGQSQNIYVSRTHLYVATNQVNYERYTDWDWKRDITRTLVFKFNLEKGLNFLARGNVPGTILNQFSMDEYQDHFRIATTIRDNWSAPALNNVYVLNKAMVTIGDLENLAPGERIYSTRFMGDRLYMVTFQQMDPLFVIDLSEPKNPKVLGALKIPGFSDYLHPFDDNHILGFGKETELDEYGIVRTKGFKMALFDVSDVEHPKQKFVEKIGEEGTESALLRNHKALLFDKEKELLAFPIQIVKKIKAEELDCAKYRYSTCPYGCESRCIPTSCTEDAEGRATCAEDCEGLGSCKLPTYSYDTYRTDFVGALVYTLNLEEGFKKRGQVTHLDAEDLKTLSYSYYGNEAIDRVLYIGDTLYSVSLAMIKANDLKTIEEVAAYTFEE